ncbi:ABC transporter ATP-binding protein [Treponema sp.]|uniref:ABC transporter ATP-binding protein n=1 Tax=Treponema sp. TaxID=166 RepID=UPI00298E8606|nr:ABC transporter ATP-binding protein [Treponema sp.]MCR5612709.1 ABC transporter ATP-binding protein [Treponema sp.]
MNILTFNDVRYSYPPVEGDVDENGKQIMPPVVFDHFSAELPAGFVSLVGPNGSGKSTFMLLASGRILPETGKIWLFGKETSTLDEQEKNELASFLYQNMEFETDEKVSELLEYVYKNGLLKGSANGIQNSNIDLLEEIKERFELNSLCNKKLNALSKGEMQRVLTSFALLYGSKSVFMDEPFFACEEYQKEYSLEYLRDFVKATGTSIYISMHELDLTKKYAELVMLFYPNHDIDLGTPDEVMTDADLEKAYGIPVSMLKHSEIMTRQQIKDESEMIRKL